MILQTPEDMEDPPPENDCHYTYLMQFVDGNRIDLSFFSLESVEEIIKDSLTIVLLDKDSIIGELPPPSDKDYIPQRPTVKEFDDCCNEFWWINPYVAKGLWREELTFAKYMLDTVLRKQLMKMLSWYVGFKTEYKKSPGKLGKYIKNYIEPELWSQLENTYSDSDFKNIWESLFSMGNLFRRIAKYVGNTFNYYYREEDDQKVTNYLKHIRELPKDAKKIF